MARYLKSDSETIRLTRHRPIEVSMQLTDAGLDPMERSKVTRYLSLNKDNEGAILDVSHPLEEANFDERIGWSKPGATELFTHTPAEADFATSNESMRHTFPKMYAMAINDFKVVAPSDNRSDMSERLAKKGSQMGAVPDVSRREYNYMGFEQDPLGRNQDLKSLTHPWSEVPKHEVQAANDLLRQEMGYSKKLSPQFEALQRFEAVHQAEERGEHTYDPSTDPNAMKLPGMD